MKVPRTQHRARSTAGFSLMELSIVMALMLTLTFGIGYGVSSIQKWKKGKNASIALQAVYASQRAYMADHPTANIATVTDAQLQPYLPQGWSAFPVLAGLNGEALTTDHTVMPPKLMIGTSVYDPSGKADDGLWDVGE
jgi:type II secretory pathway pseudopilin PulG